jgi:hypothetical protein
MDTLQQVEPLIERAVEQAESLHQSRRQSEAAVVRHGVRTDLDDELRIPDHWQPAVGVRGAVLSGDRRASVDVAGAWNRTGAIHL